MNISVYKIIVFSHVCENLSFNITLIINILCQRIYSLQNDPYICSNSYNDEIFIKYFSFLITHFLLRYLHNDTITTFIFILSVIFHITLNFIWIYATFLLKKVRFVNYFIV